jgi:hypothetical protein
MDSRVPWTYLEGAGEGVKVYGHVGGDYIAIDQTPSAISAVNIVASYTPGAALTLTLVTVTGAGITVGQSIYSPSSNSTVAGLLAIDGAAGFLTTGTAKTIAVRDPTTMISRAVRVTSGGNDSGITFTVTGYDIYGYLMHETITGANAGIATGKKAFKYIASIVASAAVASTVSVGTSDIIGLPMRADSFAYANIFVANAAITANTGFTGAVATTPATYTTGDVRGTYALQTPSNGTTTTVQMFITPSVAAMINSTNSSTFAGIYGTTQS